MRTTLTIDDDLAALIEQENHRVHEPMKQTINRLLRAGLTQGQKRTKPRRFVVEPLNTKLVASDWKDWNETALEDRLFAKQRRKAA